MRTCWSRTRSPSPRGSWPSPGASRGLLARLGIARTFSPRRYTPARVAAELGRLLDDPAFSRWASEVGEKVRHEDGVRAACNALEALLPNVHGTMP